MTANSRGLIYDLNVTEIRSIITHDMTANSRGGLMIVLTHVT